MAYYLEHPEEWDERQQKIKDEATLAGAVSAAVGCAGGAGVGVAAAKGLEAGTVATGAAGASGFVVGGVTLGLSGYFVWSRMAERKATLALRQSRSFQQWHELKETERQQKVEQALRQHVDDVLLNTQPLPDHFRCAVTDKLITYPLKTSDGKYLDRSALQTVASKEGYATTEGRITVGGMEYPTLELTACPLLEIDLVRCRFRFVQGILDQYGSQCDATLRMAYKRLAVALKEEQSDLLNKAFADHVKYFGGLAKGEPVVEPSDPAARFRLLNLANARPDYYFTWRPDTATTKGAG